MTEENDNQFVRYMTDDLFARIKNARKTTGPLTKSDLDKFDTYVGALRKSYFHNRIGPYLLRTPEINDIIEEMNGLFIDLNDTESYGYYLGFRDAIIRLKKLELSRYKKK